MAKTASFSTQFYRKLDGSAIGNRLSSSLTPDSFRVREPSLSLENYDSSKHEHTISLDHAQHPEEWIEPERKLLLCPFHAGDPNKFSPERSNNYKTCASGLLNINRVKEHLGLYGIRPKRYCHLKNKRSGTGKIDSPDISKDQITIMKSNIKRRMSEEEAWKEMFKVLFPLKPIPSACEIHVKRDAPPKHLSEPDPWVTRHMALLERNFLPKLDAIFGPISETSRAECSKALREAAWNAFKAEDIIPNSLTWNPLEAEGRLQPQSVNAISDVSSNELQNFSSSEQTDIDFLTEFLPSHFAPSMARNWDAGSVAQNSTWLSSSFDNYEELYTLPHPDQRAWDGSVAMTEYDEQLWGYQSGV